VLLNHSSNFLRFSDPAAVESALQGGIDETERAAVSLGDLYGRASLGITSVDPVTGRPSTAGDQFPDTPFAPKGPIRSHQDGGSPHPVFCARRNEQCRAVAGEDRTAAGRLSRFL
jgi:hypothetical protein